MNAILCVDDNYGLMFNHRRQSRDRVVVEKVYDICDRQPLWINDYSSLLFNKATSIDLRIDPDFLSKARPGDYVFVENCHLLNYENEIEKLFLFKWNRIYPQDFSFDLPLDAHGWKLISTEEFAGNSHEKITLEVYNHK